MSVYHIFLTDKNLMSLSSGIPSTEWQGIPDTASLREMGKTDTKYLLLYTGTTPVRISGNSVNRLIQAAEMSGAALVYSDYIKVEAGKPQAHPTIDYQTGSLRDDFDFGPLLLYRTSVFRQAVKLMQEEYRYAALYDLRLKVSRSSSIFHLPESLYTVEEYDLRASGEKQFDYVNPRNREVQLEMEKACTEHLREIGAWLPPVTKRTDPATECFPYEATVIIPVKNRAKTIADAVHSALQQEFSHSYNVIVVDNHSDDGTTSILSGIAQHTPNLVHYIPEATDLGIGGCWNEAIQHPLCGKFAIQLDSDDLYSHPRVIQTIVDTFYREQCAMVIGSYRMVNFQIEEIPPGIIDHREWTPENGHNNALRVNGLGAPRAFYTPVLRQVKFPNVSYGEDYAVGLRISAQYRIGRIFEPLYLCRRWQGNSDASLNIHRLNTYNSYKDKIRSLEILARQRNYTPEDLL